MSVFRKIDRGFGKLITYGNAFTALMVFVLMLLITADVVSRAAFNHPFQGVSEIVSNCIIILCFFEIPYGLKEGTHVRSTIVYDKVGARGKNVIDLFSYLIGIIVFSMIVYSSWGPLLKAISIHDAEIAGSVRIPTAPGRASIIIGSVLMIIEFVFLSIKAIIRIKNPDAFLDEIKPDPEIPQGGHAI